MELVLERGLGLEPGLSCEESTLGLDNEVSVLPALVLVPVVVVVEMAPSFFLSPEEDDEAALLLLLVLLLLFGVVLMVTFSL